MDASNVTGWHDLSIAMLGAAAAPIGLIFVALSVNMRQVLRYPWLASAGTILYLVAVLVSTTFMLAPGQANSVFGAELVVLGVASAGYVGTVGVRRRDRVVPQFRRQMDIQLVGGIIALALFAVTGLSLMAGCGGDLYWLLPAVLLSVSLALVNAGRLATDRRFDPTE